MKICHTFANVKASLSRRQFGLGLRYNEHREEAVRMGSLTLSLKNILERR